MAGAEIKALLVPDLTAQHAVPGLWTTNAHIRVAFEVAEAWDFAVKTILMWVKDRVNDFAFDGLGGALQIGQIDTAISAISVTPERQALIDFSNVYFASTDAIWVRADSTLKAETPNLLTTTGLGVQQGSVYEGYAQSELIDTGKMPPQNLQVYRDMGAAINDLQAGRIQALWLGSLPALNFTRDGRLKIAAQNLNQQLYGIALPQGAMVLRDKINEALITLQNNGTLARLAQEYLHVSHDQIEKPPVLPTPEPPTAKPPATTPQPPTRVDGVAWVADLSHGDQNMTNPPVMNPRAGLH